MSQNIDGKVITLEELSQTPRRVAFLDAAVVAECRETITQQKSVEFLPVHVWETYLPEKNGSLSLDTYAFRMYKIAMFGILKSGEKITVIVDGLHPFFEIRVPSGTETNKFVNKLTKICADQGFKLKETSVVSGASVKEYNDKADFVQMKFWSLGERKKALDYFDRENYETTHDDPTCYYRMICRDTLTSWTSWITLPSNGYRVVKKHKFFSTLYTIIVNYKNIKPYVGDIFKDPALKNDLTIEANFDIETYESNSELAGDVPRPSSKTADMFKISLAFTTIDADLLPPSKVDPADPLYVWEKPPGHLVHYDITMAMTAPMRNRTVIQCQNMSEMIMAFGFIINQMKPDYIVGFNSDNYDWHWITEKARQFKLLEFLEANMSIANLALYRRVEGKEFVNPTKSFECAPQQYGKNRDDQPLYAYKGNNYQYWKRYQFKISAELMNFSAACLNYPGYVCADLMPQLRAMCGNPEKYSLHVFLDMFGLGDKVDMPYKEMFRLWAENKELRAQLGELKNMKWATIEKEALQHSDSTLLARIHGNASEMRRVGEYCIVDSLRCHDLLVKTSFIRDKREVGALSYTTMDDCVYRANGMKVRNMIIAKAQSRSLHVSNRPPKKIELGKYPGAYVFPPKKGIATAKPSPAEMRISDEPQYYAWRKMSDDEFNRILIKIADVGPTLTDYGANDLVGEWPKCFIDWLAEDTHYPIAGLDFSSLYPSLIMTYNLSPEMMVHNLEKALELSAEGKKIHPISFPFNGRIVKGWSIRSRYPNRQTEIDNLLKAMLKEEDPERELELFNRLETILVDTEFGLFPSVLKMLFDQRVGIKAELKPVTKRMEEIELLTPEEFAAHADEYRELKFKFNYLNSKQKALKVFMNTFYGESGNALSPLRVLALAGGTTTAGQYNIKKVADLVQKLGCRIYYGDTDSVYISMPREAFQKYDRAYYSQQGKWAYVLMKREVKDGKTHENWEWLPVAEINNREHTSVGPLGKKAYFEALVTESFRQIKIINKAVNDALEADNGTRFLSMAFEEFLFPAAFCSKKKYFGIAHEGEFNPFPKKIFLKGLECVKKGVSQMLKDISMDIIWRTFAVDNIKSIFTIVEEKIKEIYTARNIEFDKFIKTASYKPNKKNVSVRTFHDRMALLGIAPEPLDRFRYVIVKKYPFKYDLKGRKSALSIGDQMEYDWRAKELNLEINLDYYMSSNVCGQLARFISYDERFAVTPRDDSDEAYNEAEKKNIDAAKKYIKTQYEKWSEKHQSKGPALRNLYKKVNTVFHGEFANILKVSDLWQFDIQSNDFKVANKNDEKDKSQLSLEQNQNMYQHLVMKLEKQTASESKRDADKIIGKMDIKDVADWILKCKTYQTLVAERRDIFKKRVPPLLNTLRTKTIVLKKLFEKRDSILEQTLQNLQTKLGINNENFATLEHILQKIEMIDTTGVRTEVALKIAQTVTHKDLLLLNEIDTLYLKLLSYFKIVKTSELIVEDLNNFIHFKLGNTSKIAEQNHMEDLDSWMDDNL